MAVMAPDYVHSNVHSNRRAELLSVQISMATIAVFAVVLRLISRFLVQKPGWDDYILALGTCLGLAQSILTLSCLPYGAARHMMDIPSTNDLMYILKVAYIASITGPLVMMSVKASLLLLYLRISPCTVFRRCVCFLLVLFAVDALAWSVLGSFQCLPIDHSWKWTKPGHCMNREFLYKAQGLWSLTEDIIIIILPIPTILRLQMHWRRRVLLILVFAVGLVPCGAVIARIVPTAPPSVFNSDYTWWLVSMQNWIAVEYGTGMVCASLILLKPLFQLLASTRRSAAAAWPGQPKRSDSGGRARLPMSQDVTSSTVRAPRGADLMPRKDQLEIRGIHIQDCASIPKESPTPLSYLEGLRSPDLESCVSEDPFSTLPSQPRHSGTVDPQQRYELHDIHAG